MSSQSQPTGIKKRLAVPPVKVACLSCRASRIRCDGKEPCSGCENRSRECLYVQSRRGGARVSRRKKGEQQSDGYVKILQDCLPTMVKPGAGLTSLDESLLDTDNLFDGIFAGTSLQPEVEEESHTSPQTGLVRRYQSNPEILDAYYVWIHPFFPILPPPIETGALDNLPIHHSEAPNDNFEPTSPATLAISAILTLIPLPNTPSSFHEKAVITRRQTSHLFAQKALQTIESDSELPDSTISPAQALSNETPQITRSRFHPNVPVELEAVIALSILSVYEYAQRGNIRKMRDRANRALVMAMDLGLHEGGGRGEGFAEAVRRVWWMTYICACQASIVSSTPPPMSLFDLRCTTSLPTSPVPEAWPMFIKSQQTILSATQFVSDLNQALEGKSDFSTIQTRMQDLHEKIEPLLAELDNSPNTYPSNNDVETTVAFSLRQMSKIKLNSARIKLHRYSAFSDIPVFSEKHCDLQKSPPILESSPFQTSSTAASPSCCSQPLPTSATSLTTSLSLSPPQSTSTSTSTSTSPFPSPSLYTHPFPYTRHESSRLCLNSALQIATAFGVLPFPRPPSTSTTHPSDNTRTMPSFACCAMQSAYALLMIYHRTWVVGKENDLLAVTLLARCEDGLRQILRVLGNYSGAFEGLGGMRDQIQAALDCLSLPDE